MEPADRAWWPGRFPTARIAAPTQVRPNDPGDARPYAAVEGWGVVVTDAWLPKHGGATTPARLQRVGRPRGQLDQPSPLSSCPESRRAAPPGNARPPPGRARRQRCSTLTGSQFWHHKGRASDAAAHTRGRALPSDCRRSAVSDSSAQPNNAIAETDKRRLPRNDPAISARFRVPGDQVTLCRAANRASRHLSSARIAYSASTARQASP